MPAGKFHDTLSGMIGFLAICHYAVCLAGEKLMAQSGYIMRLRFGTPPLSARPAFMSRLRHGHPERARSGLSRSFTVGNGTPSASLGQRMTITGGNGRIVARWRQRCHDWSASGCL